MTVKAKDLPTNNLNINEIEQNTPPNSLDLRSGKRGRPVSIVVPHIIKLVSRLIKMADEDYTLLTPIDREVLRDVLTCGSIEKVAKKQHKSDTYIRNKVNDAIDALTDQIKIWKAPHRKLMEQSRRIQALEKVLENDRKNKELAKNLSNMLDIQAHKYSMLESENLRLKEEIIRLKAERPLVDSQISNSMVKADEKTKRTLKLCLEDINIPSDITNKLKAYEIKAVYDLVRYNENQLSRFGAISYSDLLRINKGLRKTGLSLGTDVRWIEATQEYFIYPNKN